jgi:hypothetical protein
MRCAVNVIRESRTSVMVIAAASVLAACASTAPVSSTAPAAASTTAASTSDTGQVPFITPRGFRVETKSGENYYCQRVTRTGSRAKATETCYTLAEITQMRETGQDFLNRMQTTPGNGPVIDEDGGMYNTAVNNPNTQ